MARPKKALITRDKTLAAALKIVDKEGLDALSIRRLGRALNVQGISLYHHFKNKDEILAAVCGYALADVRTPTSPNQDWREWLLQNVMRYRRALQEHPNLVPVLMRRHPLRIGLAEHNATAGMLAVQGVPPELVMPLIEALEELALGSASYQSAVDSDPHAEKWRTQYPYLFHLSKKTTLTKSQLFLLTARAIIEAITTQAQRDAAIQDYAKFPEEFKF